MKKVDIVYDFQHQFPKVKIDNEYISQYSDLGIIESNDLHRIASKLKKVFRNELEESYSVSVKGPSFTGRMLKELLAGDPNCIDVSYCEDEHSEDFRKECVFIASLMKKYGRDNNVLPVIRVSGPAAGELRESFLMLTNESPDWYITKPGDTASADLPTVSLHEDAFSIREVEGVPEISLPTGWEHDFFDYIYERTALLPFALKGRNTCEQVGISEEEIKTLHAYKDGDAVYVFELEQDRVDAGSDCRCVFSVYPPEKSDAYKLEILPTGAASFKDNRLSVHDGDTITINILDNRGIVRESRLIKVVHHNYVSEVKVFPEKFNIESGEKVVFECFPIPSVAEDAGELEVSVSDSSIASVVDKKFVVGLNAGRTDLVIKGKRYHGSIPITVVPKLEGIALDEKKIDIELGKDKAIHCKVYPRGARFEKPEWKLDNVKLGNINVSQDGMSCRFTATTEAFEKGRLVCELPEAGISEECEINIVPVRQPTLLMALAWIFTGVGCIAGLFIFPMAAAGGSAITGYFMDFFMPIGLIFAIIGRRMNNKNSNDVFIGAILTNILYAAFMILVGAAMCG